MGNITNDFCWFPVRKVVVDEGVLSSDVNVLQFGVNNKSVGVEEHPGIHCFNQPPTNHCYVLYSPRSQDIFPVAVGEISDYRVSDIMTVNT